MYFCIFKTIVPLGYPLCNCQLGIIVENARKEVSYSLLLGLMGGKVRYLMPGCATVKGLKMANPMQSTNPEKGQISSCYFKSTYNH